MIRKTRFIKRSIGAILLASSVSFFWSGCNSPPPRRAAAERSFPDFSSAQVDFGGLPWNTEMPFELEFRNYASSPATIVAVQPSCGCTDVNTAEIVDREIRPGDAVYLSGLLRSGERVGLHQEHIDVMLASGLVRTVHLEYEVIASYEVRPGEIVFAPVAVSLASQERMVRTIVFNSLGAGLSRVSSSVPWVESATRQLNDRETEIAVAIRPELMDPGLNEGIVFVETDDANRAVQTVSVRAELRAALRAVPRRLFLRDGDEGVVYLVNDKGDRVPISEVVASDSALDLDYSLDQGGAVTLRWSEAGEQSGTTIRVVALDGQSVDVQIYTMD